MIQLPEGYWSTIEAWYPNYNSCEKVYASDLITRIIEDELDAEFIEINRFKTIMDHVSLQEAKRNIDTELYVKALEAQVKELTLRNTPYKNESL